MNSPHPAPLWLAVHLPRLPLEAQPTPPSPSVIVRRGRILVADAGAEAAGIEAGMSLVVARALAPALAALPQDVAREARALERLACWAGAVSPRLTLAPAALLLEIGACLRLFGGLERIAARVAAGVAGQGFTARLAAAPTPQGALWLAGAGEEVAALCADLAALCARLDALPLAALDLPAESQQRLHGFGLRRLGEARRLPAAALARRIGAEPLAQVARAYGELPDPRPDFVFPARFDQRLDLPAPVERADALLFAARRLTAALAGWLAARRLGILEGRLVLGHRGRPATPVLLRFAAATDNEVRLACVLREKLERLPLAAPVESLRLAARVMQPLAERSRGLFDAGGEDGAGEGMAALVERLRARLGDERLHGLAVAADHRPECATTQVARGVATEPVTKCAAKSVTKSAAPPRPFWLLARPEPLAEVGGRPQRRGALTLLAGPERIESGWWDAGERSGAARRDYFVALTADGRWAWIFRELAAPGGWYLHGWFA